ncbi:MAG TPA: hemolysin family protein [Candidatus Brocadiia bacterium]|nr:hemolysin family protein [Candidatus Brocadiia bacterium]
MTLIICLASIAMCLALQAFFVGCEMGLISCDRIRLRHRSASGDERARILEDFLANPKKLFGTTLVGTNVAIVLSSSVASWLMVSYIPEDYERWEAAVATALMWPLTVFLGQLIPSGLFRRHADMLVLLVARPLRTAYMALYPAVALTTIITEIVTRMATGRKSARTFDVGRDELQLIFDEYTRGASGITREILSDIFEFADADVPEVMVPLVDVVAVPAETNMQALCEQIRRSGHGFIPVYKDRIDNIVGVAAIWKVMAADEKATAGDIMAPPLIVPESMPAEELLSRLLRTGNHLAVVVDEYGGATGIVTFKDLVEEVVGDIPDEHDREDVVMMRAGNQIAVDARAKISDLNEKFELDLPESEAYETAGGFIEELLERIPATGEKVQYNGMTFIIENATDRRIVSIRIISP